MLRIAEMTWVLRWSRWLINHAPRVYLFTNHTVKAPQVKARQWNRWKITPTFLFHKWRCPAILSCYQSILPPLASSGRRCLRAVFCPNRGRNNSLARSNGSLERPWILWVIHVSEHLWIKRFTCSQQFADSSAFHSRTVLFGTFSPRWSTFSGCSRSAHRCRPGSSPSGNQPDETWRQS